MTSYSIIKFIHITTVILSLSGFILRAYWRFFSPDKLDLRAVRVVPHINDALLLVSAITLSSMLGQYPFTHDWLTAKVLLLLVYIVAGSFTLKKRYPPSTSFFALLIAVSSFAGIVFIAIGHSY